jgi:hypothetical protein
MGLPGCLAMKIEHKFELFKSASWGKIDQKLGKFSSLKFSLFKKNGQW